MAIAKNDIRHVVYPHSADCDFNSAMLFGRYAYEVATTSSDIDINADISTATTPKQIFKLAYDLGEAIGSSLDACGSRKVRAKKQIETEIAPSVSTSSAYVHCRALRSWRSKQERKC